MSRLFDISNWYWIIGNDGSHFYSSAKPGFVDPNDPGYLAFVDNSNGEGGVVTRIASLEELREVLLQEFPDGWKRNIDDMSAAIKAERDLRIQTGGYKVSSVNKWFHSDTLSRTQQIGLTLLGANIPANTQWKTMDGTFVTMTPSLASQIFAAAAANDIAVFTIAQTHIAAMSVLSDPSSYDFSVNWPQTFQESQS